MMSAMEKVRQVRMGSPIWSGLIYAFGSLLIFTLITSLILLFTSASEASLTFYVYIIHGLALVVGGFIGGKRAGMKGWYYGGLVGVIYNIVILLIGFLAFDAPMLTLHSLMILTGSFVSASIGGILGVNANK